MRCGDPDALDSIVPMAFGNLALDLVLDGTSGRLVNVRNGRYDNVPIDVVTSRKKVVDVEKYYIADRLRPRYENFENQPAVHHDQRLLTGIAGAGARIASVAPSS